jgi:hypothetical protein
LQIVAVLGLVAFGLWWHFTRSAALRSAEENGFLIADRTAAKYLGLCLVED